MYIQWGSGVRVRTHTRVDKCACMCDVCVCTCVYVCVCVYVGECSIRTEIHGYVKTRSGKVHGIATLTNEA